MSMSGLDQVVLQLMMQICCSVWTLWYVRRYRQSLKFMCPPPLFTPGAVPMFRELLFDGLLKVRIGLRSSGQFIFRRVIIAFLSLEEVRERFYRLRGTVGALLLISASCAHRHAPSRIEIRWHLHCAGVKSPSTENQNSAVVAENPARSCTMSPHTLWSGRGRISGLVEARSGRTGHSTGSAAAAERLKRPRIAAGATSSYYTLRLLVHCTSNSDTP